MPHEQNELQKAAPECRIAFLIDSFLVVLRDDKINSPGAFVDESENCDFHANFCRGVMVLCCPVSTR